MSDQQLVAARKSDMARGRKNELFAEFTQALGHGDFRCPELFLWGNSEKDDISLSAREGSVAQICVRLDLRQPNHLLIEKICDAAIKFDWIYYTQDRLIVAPLPQAVERAACRSKAVEFVRNPSEFFDRHRQRTLSGASASSV